MTVLVVRRESGYEAHKYCDEQYCGSETSRRAPLVCKGIHAGEAQIHADKITNPKTC